MTLRDLQEEQKPWVEHNFSGRPAYIPLLGAVEELGELAHAHIKGVQQIRHTPEEIVAKKRDAVGDTVIYLADYCTAEGLDFQECVEAAWNEVKQRDWKKNKTTGTTTPPEPNHHAPTSGTTHPT